MLKQLLEAINKNDIYCLGDYLVKITTAEFKDDIEDLIRIQRKKKDEIAAKIERIAGVIQMSESGMVGVNYLKLKQELVKLYEELEG
jgi:hypothetical protein